MSQAVLAENICVAYDGFEALRRVHFALPEGAFLTIIGPNGAGKTTLLNVIIGLQSPNQGSVKLFGKDPRAFPPQAMGYVPQVKTLDRSFPARAVELVLTGFRRSWPVRPNNRERDEALAALRLAGVEHLADRSVSALSGGELQRVYLARGLARRPKLMVMDEPAAGIDAAGVAEMYHLLLRQQKEYNMTVLMITHDWEGARVHASHVLLLDRELLRFGDAKDVAKEELLLQVFGHRGHVSESHEKRPYHA